MNDIPELDTTRYAWSQPKREHILVDDETAIMSAADYKLLPEYSTSFPSGVYPGKMWKRIERGTEETYLCWYGEEMNGGCHVHFRKLIIGDWRKLFGVEDKLHPASWGVYQGIAIKSPQAVVKLITT